MKNENGFEVAADGFVQLSPLGEFLHKGAGVTQVIDARACELMAEDFRLRAGVENFPGLLVDFDHFSLDTDKPSEAAGWVTAMEARPDGLWAKVRWSDSGRAAVTGGRYRLVSPVFRHPGGTEDLGGGRVRPVTVESVALTNEPNIKGGKPIANRQVGVGNRQSAVGGEEGEANAERSTSNAEHRTGEGDRRFMWLLGNPEKGPHCGECVSRHGKVKTREEWKRMEAPKCRCCCTLAEVGVDVPEDYVAPAITTVALENRWAKPWGDKARAASLAVRQAKAAARKAAMSLAAKARGEVGAGAEGRGRRTEGGGRTGAALAGLRPPASDRRIVQAVRQDKARVRQAAEAVRQAKAKRRKAEQLRRENAQLRVKSVRDQR